MPSASASSSSSSAATRRGRRQRPGSDPAATGQPHHVEVLPSAPSSSSSCSSSSPSSSSAPPLAVQAEWVFAETEIGILPIKVPASIAALVRRQRLTVLLRATIQSADEEAGLSGGRTPEGHTWRRAEPARRVHTCMTCPTGGRKRLREMDFAPGFLVRRRLLAGRGRLIIDDKGMRSASQSLAADAQRPAAVRAALGHAVLRHILCAPPLQGIFWGLASFTRQLAVVAPRAASLAITMLPDANGHWEPTLGCCAWTTQELEELHLQQRKDMSRLGTSACRPEPFAKRVSARIIIMLCPVQADNGVHLGDLTNWESRRQLFLPAGSYEEGSEVDREAVFKAAEACTTMYECRQAMGLGEWYHEVTVRRKSVVHYPVSEVLTSELPGWWWGLAEDHGAKTWDAWDSTAWPWFRSWTGLPPLSRGKAKVMLWKLLQVAEPRWRIIGRQQRVGTVG